MIIKKIKIQGFGYLMDKEITLSDRLNIIYGENETGKSTIAEFIKAILYGIDTGIRNIRDNERLHYRPLDGNNMGGSLLISHGGKEYLITRNFGKTKKSDKLSVIDNVTGADIDMTPEDLIGLNSDSFMKTLYIKQLCTKVEGSKDDEILKRLINLSQTGQEESSYQNAKTILNDALKELTSKSKGIIPRINNEIAILQSERAESLQSVHKAKQIDDDIKECKSQQEILNNKLKEQSKEAFYKEQYSNWQILKEQARMQEKLDEEQAKSQKIQLEFNLNSAKSKQNNILILSVISTLLTISSFFILPLLLFIVPTGIFIYNYIKGANKIKAIEEDIKQIGKETCNNKVNDVKYKQLFLEELGSNNYDNIPSLIEKYCNNFKEKQQNINSKIIRLAERARDLQNEKDYMCNRPVVAIDQDITMKKNKLNSYKQKEVDIKKAIESLDTAFAELEQNFAPKLNVYTSKVITNITGGKYNNVRADNVYNLTLTDNEGNLIKSDYLSTGCYDQIYFALRMGMIELLDIDAPIILDDALAYYDDNRLNAAMNYIKDLKKQVIMFTCQKREQGGNMIAL